MSKESVNECIDILTSFLQDWKMQNVPDGVLVKVWMPNTEDGTMSTITIHGNLQLGQLLHYMGTEYNMAMRQAQQMSIPEQKGTVA